MNRCTTRRSYTPSRRMLISVFAGALLGHSALASAQTNIRNFPLNAQRGLMVVTYPPIIQMNGKDDRLSPGSRIRGMDNLIVLSGTLIGQSLIVNFVRNPTGEVHDVWILTSAEAALRLPTQQ